MVSALSPLSRPQSSTTPTPLAPAHGSDRTSEAAAARSISEHSASPGANALVARYDQARSLARSSPSSGAAVQARLNAFANEMTGPYRVAGKTVHVAPAFRMVGGMNQASAQAYVQRIREALGSKGYAAVANDVGYVVVGKGTPDQLKRVTQALIDSPAFAKYSKGDPELGVRRMMWDHGIGMDCSGYVHHALQAVHPRAKLGDPLASPLQSPPKAQFERIHPEATRPGDVVLLTTPGDAGHKVIVFARHEVPTGSELHGKIARALNSGNQAEMHLLEVDSSWGAGGQPERGGVKREVWAYDASSGRWASLVKGNSGQWHVTTSTTSGPYDHELKGIYRFRGNVAVQ